MKEKEILTSSGDSTDEPEPKLKPTSADEDLEGESQASDLGFEVVTEEKCDDMNVLYLFARTGREKEDWFKRLSAAANGEPLGGYIPFSFFFKLS